MTGAVEVDHLLGSSLQPLITAERGPASRQCPGEAAQVRVRPPSPGGNVELVDMTGGVKVDDLLGPSLQPLITAEPGAAGPGAAGPGRGAPAVSRAEDDGSDSRASALACGDPEDSADIAPRNLLPKM